MYNDLIKDQYLEFEENDQIFVFFIDQGNKLQFVGSFMDEMDYFSPSVKSFFESCAQNRDLKALNLTVDLDPKTNLYFVNGSWEMPQSSIEFFSLVTLIKDALFSLDRELKGALEQDLIYVKKQA